MSLFSSISTFVVAGTSVLLSTALAMVDTGMRKNVGKAQEIGFSMTLTAVSTARRSSRSDTTKLQYNGKPDLVSFS